jgi:hypothetical protein
MYGPLGAKCMKWSANNRFLERSTRYSISCIWSFDHSSQYIWILTSIEMAKTPKIALYYRYFQHVQGNNRETTSQCNSPINLGGLIPHWPWLTQRLLYVRITWLSTVVQLIKTWDHVMSICCRQWPVGNTWPVGLISFYGWDSHCSKQGKLLACIKSILTLSPSKSNCLRKYKFNAKLVKIIFWTTQPGIVRTVNRTGFILEYIHYRDTCIN